VTGVLLVRLAAGSVHLSFMDAAFAPTLRVGTFEGLSVSRAPGDD
jgi:hypothetical protein